MSILSKFTKYDEIIELSPKGRAYICTPHHHLCIGSVKGYIISRSNNGCGYQNTIEFITNNHSDLNRFDWMEEEFNCTIDVYSYDSENLALTVTLEEVIK